MVTAFIYVNNIYSPNVITNLYDLIVSASSGFGLTKKLSWRHWNYFQK